MFILSVSLICPLKCEFWRLHCGKSSKKVTQRPLHAASSLQRFSDKNLYCTHFTDEETGVQEPYNELMADFDLSVLTS